MTGCCSYCKWMGKMWKLLRGRAGPRSRAAALDSNTDHSPPKQPPPTIHNREHGSGRCAVARRGQLTAARRRAAEKRRARCTATQRRVRARVQRAASLANAGPWQSRHTRGSAEGAQSVEHHCPLAPQLHLPWRRLAAERGGGVAARIRGNRDAAGAQPKVLSPSSTTAL